MKRTILAIILASTLITTESEAQDVNRCRPIAERILTAAQNQTPDGIDELLAPDFHFNDIKQPTAGKVLKKIIAQMPAFTDWKLADNEQGIAGLMLRYTITKPDSTTSEVRLLFNADNLVLEADLLNADISLRKVTPTAKAKPGVSMTSVPIHRHDGLPIVTVNIDGQPCNMFFDTGAPGVILNSKYFAHDIDGQVMRDGRRGVVGTGSVSGMHHVKLMEMGGVSLSETDIMTSDLSNLETVGVAVHGILGQSFYKDFDIFFNFKRDEIVMLNPDTTHQWIAKEGCRCQSVSGTMKGHLLTIGCLVGGLPTVLAFDSGAQTNLLDSDWPKRHPHLVKGIKKVSLTGYGEGEAAVSKGKCTLTLGGRKFKKQRTIFSDVSHLKESKGVDGLFGCEVLAKQKLIISYKRQELLLID